MGSRIERGDTCRDSRSTKSYIYAFFVSHTEQGWCAMLYALTKKPDHATGLHKADPDPVPIHLGCEGPLALQEESGKWSCAPCRKIGYLVFDLSQLEPAPPTPTAKERMQRRWDGVWPGTHDAPDLTDPMTWEPFFKEYFAQGIWLMRAHDDAKHTIPDDSFLYLGFDIGVGLPDDGATGLPEVAILDVNSHHPRFFKNILAVRELDFGILLLTNDKGEHVRLDAHTLKEDEEAVNMAREQYYGRSKLFGDSEDQP